MQESANGLLEMVKGMDASMIKVVHLQVKAPVHYVALLPPFINHLKQRLESESVPGDKWCLTADFTHSLEVMGYQYGLACSLPFLGWAKHYLFSSLLVTSN